jgi:hypothetical protein
MLKLENWSDLFNFNRTLFEDDFNPAQALVVKSKQKSADGVTVSHRHWFNFVCGIGVLHDIQAWRPRQG